MHLPKGLKEVRVAGRLAPAIGLVLGLAPAVVHAQTNIDQGKSPGQIFAADCASCHKSARGLANGKNSFTLASFLREHYTSSSEQAAQLAAYVLGAGGGAAPAATQGRGQKPPPAAPDHARGPAEEAKPGNRAATRQPGKPELPGAAQSPTTFGTEEPTPAGPGRRPAAGRRDQHPTTATRGRQPDVAPPEPAAIVAEPAAPAAPGREAPAEVAPTASAPVNAESGDAASVPRDNIPD